MINQDRPSNGSSAARRIKSVPARTQCETVSASLRNVHLFVAAVLIGLLSGCASHYDLTLSNGHRVRASTKPVLTPEGYYVFKDLAGKDTMVNSMRVREIETVRRGSKPKTHFQ
jgi:hypothetical protein